MGFSGNLEKMQITAYRKNNFQGAEGTFSVYINPEKYTREYEIKYSNPQAPGDSSGTPEYNKTQSDKVNFELIFDGTGVVPNPLPASKQNPTDGISEQIDKFLGLIFEYDGQIHSPNYLELNWGTLSFRCRLCSLKMTYTMFKPDGTPLRAKAEASFVEYTNKIELAKEENDSSPDLSHVFMVKAGDTLPLMCYEIYGSSQYYPQVARVNGLTDFRNLSVGSQLLFPPLDTTFAS